ncbi:disintegrin and metalloproteinase domain-containing protein 12-like [Gigantopelta aegis]|uniref:disintegrin and metalloproteinase domain-containing protein 12-like n=1 Tax=Gigantopelta aegis TaxID=1735272 RepID=UPI001B88C49E|nr:disintegrin and metalloproteinase domain-containing protein 12-like [Gigantopelta aegis]
MDLLLGFPLHLLCFLLQFPSFISGFLPDGTRSRIPGQQSGFDVFHRYEVIVPEIFHKNKRIDGTINKGSHLDNISVLFSAFNRSFVLDLKLNRDLFSNSYIEKQYHSAGSSIVKPHKDSQRENHCFYHGTIRYIPQSLVALSTCEGLRGIVSNEDDVFHIEHYGPNRHVIFRDRDRKKKNLKCGSSHHHSAFVHLGKRAAHRKKRAIRGPYDSNKNTRYVELYLVSDYRTYERNNRNLTKVIRRSQDIANIVSRLYRPLNIYIALVGVEVWQNGDQVSISESADTTMENFLRYRRERINPYHRNDNAQLVTGIFFDHGVVGKAIKGPMCTYQFSGGVNMDYDGLVTLVATTVAHEMGHNFGMEHDNDSSCYCSKEKCIMAATSGQTSPTQWSSCSKMALQEAFELGMDYCLKNKPTKLFDGPVCGNGFVEVGEECDCGLPQDCHNICCNSTTCKLYPQAVCGTGRCCDLTTCQMKGSASLCREPTSECDFPEFCTGLTEYCPADVYKQNGLSCMNSQSYCYNGQCSTHTDQCKLLWGNTGRASDPICFQQLNIQGDQDGNCGYNWTTDSYLACNRRDVMCGLLHCVHLNEKLMFWRDNLAHTMRASFLTRGNTQYVCRSAMLDVGLDMPDPGMVPDGAKCDTDKVCVNHKCVPLVKMAIDQCPTVSNKPCNNKGVCNSKGHCHCNNGYAPPLCNRPGYGGSVDSGPATNEIEDKSLLIGLLIFFLVILPLIGGAAFFGYYYREKIKKWWNYGPKLKYGIPGKKAKPPPHPPRPTVRFSENPPKTSPARRQPSVIISDPVLTGSTNRNSQVFLNQNRSTSLSPKHDRVLPQQDSVRKVDKHTSDKSSIPSYDWSLGAQLQQETSTNANAEKPAPFKKERLGLPGQAVVNRTSFRGSEISSPIFVSTTNRNSEVFSNQLGDDPSRSRLWGSHSPPPVPPHGKDITVRRNHSDRPAAPRPTSVPPQVKKGPILHKSQVSTSMRTQRPPPPPRPLPPDPRLLESDAETDSTYQNDPSTVSQTDNTLVNNSNSQEAGGGDNLYLNVNSSKEIQYCNMASPEDDSFSASTLPSYSTLFSGSSARSKFLKSDSARPIKGSINKPNDAKSARTTAKPETNKVKVGGSRAQDLGKPTQPSSQTQQFNRLGQSIPKTDSSKPVETSLKKPADSAKTGPGSAKHLPSKSTPKLGSVSTSKSVSKPSESGTRTRIVSKPGQSTKVQGATKSNVTDEAKRGETDSRRTTDTSKVKPAGSKAVPGQISRVAMLQSKFNTDSSTSGGHSATQAGSRPYVAPKPSPTVTRSFNV